MQQGQQNVIQNAEVVSDSSKVEIYQEKQQSNLASLATAINTESAQLSDFERDKLAKLIKTYNAKIGNNNTRWNYYKDRNVAQTLGIAVPKSLQKKMAVATGWANKSVSMLAERSLFDGFSVKGKQVGEINEILDKNDFELMYEEAVPSELVFGCGFFTILNDTDNLPIIRFYDARNAVAVWDYDKRHIKYGFVVNDYELTQANYERPSQVIFFTDTQVITIRYIEGKWFVESAQPHLLKEPPMVAMAYKPSSDLPFGRSRISKATMAIIDSQQREIMNTEVSSELYSRPKEFWIGVSEDQFDSKSEMDYFKPLIAMERDEDGELPRVEQLKQSAMTPHVDLQRLYVSRMAGEASIPVNSLGIIHDNPASAEALKASLEDLCVLAEKMNRINGRALEKVIRIALSIKRGKQLEDIERVDVSFRNPFTPSIAARTDAMTKQATLCPWLTQTEIYWEELGYTAAERNTIMAEQKRIQREQEFNQLMYSIGVNNGAVKSDGVGSANQNEGNNSTGSEQGGSQSSSPNELRDGSASQESSNTDNK